MHSAATSRPQPRPGSHDHPHQSSLAITCILYCLVAFLFFGVAYSIGVIVALILEDPKIPQVDLQEVYVQYINVVNATTTTASLSLAIRMLFSARNNNSRGIEYGVSTFNITYRGIPLCWGTAPGFYQPEHGVRLVETTVRVDGVNLVQGDAAELVRDASLDDRVELRVIGGVNAELPDPPWWLSTYTIPLQASIDCVIAISPRKEALTYKRCGFEGLKV